MKSHLSNVMPVHEAAEILGRPTVARIVRALFMYRRKTLGPVELQRLQEVEESLLIDSLFHKTETKKAVPPTVTQAWKQWTSLNALGFDKTLLWKFVVPHAQQPYSGPAGHMGLYDCLTYALQSHALSSTTSSYYNGAAGQTVYLPDLLIALAIATRYRDYQMGNTEEDPNKLLSEEENNERESTVWTMATLAFGVYNAYQKKGSVTRDTVHRFLTDVLGEESFKQPNVMELLDFVFESTNADAGIHAAISELQFSRRVLDTLSVERGHILLDWLSCLLACFVPPPELADTVTAYMDLQDNENQGSGSLLPAHDLDNLRLYEVKRRFHSLVQASNCLLQGDPMKSDTSTIVTDIKHAITASSFCQAVSTPSSDMGHGGYLPESVAKVIFAGGSRKRATNEEENNGAEGEAPLLWTLDQVLEFGSVAVRVGVSTGTDPDVPLLRFLFRSLQSDPSNITLQRRDMTHLLVLMLHHADFRLETTAGLSETEEDAPPSEEEEANQKKLIDLDEDAMVDIDTAHLLGIVPPKIARNAKDDEEIKFGVLVDYALKNCAKRDSMTFEEFMDWNSSDVDGPKSRLGPLMVDLRLVAAVLFGIPPTLASMEVQLIAELERRHKARFPQSNVSRRGPRGTIWYLVDSKWLGQWTAHVRAVSGTPEDATHQYPNKRGVRGIDRINNAGLMAENGSLALRGDIRWKHDYEILPPLAWHGLQAWYDGGPPIHRSVVKYIAAAPSPHSNRSRIPTENEIELYPLFVSLWLCDAASRGQARPFQQNFQLSRVTPMGVTLLSLCKELQVNPDRARLWVVAENPNRGPYDPIDTDTTAMKDWILDLRSNIVDQRKQRNQEKMPLALMLELKDPKTDLWPRGADGKEWMFQAGPEKTPLSNLGDGVVGLYNMGNTCYLNSSIQCLSHTPIFRDYFTSKAYLKDINPTNPLGHKGQLAAVSAVLINSLWKQFKPGNSNTSDNRITPPGSYVMVNAPSLTPKTFKESLGTFNEHFAGNEQHDAQELLAFLLGGLSEDLNRIQDKPYIEAPDSDGRPDHELAEIWWSNHLKREFSIVVALFTGQYKSLLTCRSCGYESARFEPFSFLQLPLPEDDQLSVSLILYPVKTGTPTLKYTVRVSADGTIKDVLISLAKLLHTEEKETPREEDSEEMAEVHEKASRNFSVADMKDAYISKIVPNRWTLHDLQSKETGDLPLLHVFELAPALQDEVIVEETRKELEKVAVEEKKSDTKEKDESGKVTFRKKRSAFLAIAQRRSEILAADFLHPLAHRVFGTPILMRVNDLPTMTGRELYDLVAERLKCVVPKSVLGFLEMSSPDHKEESTPALDPSANARRAGRTTSTMEEVSAGPIPRYGFRLRSTSRDGRRCLTCPWYDGCIGCLVFDNENPALVMDGDSLVVDWHFAVSAAVGFPAQQQQQTRSSDNDAGRPQATPRSRIGAVTIKNHPSTGGSKPAQVAGAITLEECLESFSKEEKIPDTYCSQCKDFRIQTKQMSLWRLPPVVIIQLKRFQFTQHMRRKLRDLVIFPMEGLDLTNVFAPDSQTKAHSGGGEEDATDTESSNKDDGRSEMLYDLYGVVHHQGALSGGHYVASLKSDIDGKWRLFNDAQIYEIHDRHVVDSSAYILFYMRRDLTSKKLSDFWQPSDVSALSEADMDNLVNGKTEKCVIS